MFSTWTIYFSSTTWMENKWKFWAAGLHTVKGTLLPSDAGVCFYTQTTTHCIRSTTIHKWKTVLVFVARKCVLSLVPLMFVCLHFVYVLILEREVRWTLPLFSKNIPSIEACIISSFWHTAHALTHTHTHIDACNLTTLNNFLIRHCVVTMLCARLIVRLPVCVSGKWLGVMAQRVGWETAGDYS